MRRGLYGELTTRQTRPMIHPSVPITIVHQPTIPIVSYHDLSATPLPRIFRFIAILTMLYGAANIGQAASPALMISPLRRIPRFPATPGEYWLWAIGCAIQITIGALLIWGAFRLLRGASHRLILIGFWTLIA